MARIFKQRYSRSRAGKAVSGRTKKWYVRYKDHEGIRRTVPGFADKAASQQLAAKLEREAAQRKTGLIDRFAEHRKRRLLGDSGAWDKVNRDKKLDRGHLGDFEAHVRRTATSNKYVETLVPRIRILLERCKFDYWSDITAAGLSAMLDKLRNEGLSVQTTNFYLESAKRFCGWKVREGRAPDSPIAFMKGGNVRTDRRHDRRALSPEDLSTLIRKTASEPKRGGMTGPERALFYHFLAETGIRVSEARSLTGASFRLSAKPPTVVVLAAYSKHRRDDTLLLRAELAAKLKSFLSGKTPTAAAFKLPDRPVKLLKRDLAAAGIPYVDDANKFADLHSLRHSFISNLARAQVHPNIAKELARHSTITLTMDRYTHCRLEDQQEAIERLPSISPPDERESLRATGSDAKGGMHVAPGNAEHPCAGGRQNHEKLTCFLTSSAAAKGHSVSATDARQGRARGGASIRAGQRKALKTSGSGGVRRGVSPADATIVALRPAGFEPATPGLGNRCSIQLSYERDSRRFLPDQLKSRPRGSQRTNSQSSMRSPRVPAAWHGSGAARR